MSGPYDPYPIDHSIAYSDVCSWANDEPYASRPKLATLDKALKHAQFLEDYYIVRKIREAYAIWEDIEITPTPRDCHPPPSPEALAMESELTRRFQVFRRPGSEVQVFETDLLGVSTKVYSPLMDENN